MRIRESMLQMVLVQENSATDAVALTSRSL